MTRSRNSRRVEVGAPSVPLPGRGRRTGFVVVALTCSVLLAAGLVSCGDGSADGSPPGGAEAVTAPAPEPSTSSSESSSAPSAGAAPEPSAPSGESLPAPSAGAAPEPSASSSESSSAPSAGAAPEPSAPSGESLPAPSAGAAPEPSASSSESSSAPSAGAAPEPSAPSGDSSSAPSAGAAGETPPAAPPAGVWFSRQESAIVLTWDPVPGATHYNVYHDDFFDSACFLEDDGSPRFCSELAAGLRDTSFVHDDPAAGVVNFYWVTACNSAGCSGTDEENPAWSLATGARPSRRDFPEARDTVRLLPENVPGGINVGRPVASGFGGAVTYTLGGPDANSFTIVPETGQIRTREGVTFDTEVRARFVVTVGMDAADGVREEVEVTILLDDLRPACRRLDGLRTNHGDQRLTVRWLPAPEAGGGRARVLGYETEIRRGRTEPWTGRRAILGRNIDSTVYAGLVNGEDYQVRVRPINSEGECRWSAPVWGTPADSRSPWYPYDRFGNDPVGDEQRHWRIVSAERCRYTADGITADADCTFENTGPHTFLVRLDFDDPARGSCALSLAFSSLTAGSFLDECGEAGVNTDVPFDIGFRLPPGAPRSGAELEPPATGDPPQRAPRTQSEFEALVSGRDDFIPGLAFGVSCYYCAPGARGDPVLGLANRIEYNADGTPAREVPGTIDYRNTGPSSAVLTFEGNDGRTYVFNLEFEASGVVRATTTDHGGNPMPWSGLQSLGTPPEEPMLLPVPPSWDSTIAIGTGPGGITDLDAAPDDWGELMDRVYYWTTPDPDGPRATPLERLLERTLFETLPERLLEENVELGYEFEYTKLGRNRAVVTVDFSDFEILRRRYSDEYEELSDYQKSVAGSRLVIHLTFLSEDSFHFSARHLRDGYPPDVTRGLIDLSGDIVNMEVLPDELVPPAAPPQAAGEDRTGVEIAAALTVSEIGGNEIQIFLVSDPSPGPDSYRPGDWLEPKDGSNQRMMIVGAGPQAVALRGAGAGAEVVTLAFNSPRSSLASFAVPIDENGDPVQDAGLFGSPALHTVGDTSIMQIAVVCMQFDRAIPTRGARYFSVPKRAEGPVQACQQDCVLNEPDSIQACVWTCEETDG